ncbi:potassium/proton antiporter [Sedimentisphaera cyanobacteriorum]|uniref:Potassium/proton antiporter n=1 Tax=Sedimentisphaera cyanobacteriorum TaxID=1940790 RepID=A0A1Q2HR05_9BACT|nr:cation:proton antiporter [Sedimentisphaera cyanobacteriorum]AQQ09673.1 potassium/proton antiporter [Sedimentisphaera cyanobacteriorum]
MALGIAELILLGLLVDWLMRFARIPGLVGLLLLGVVMGPHFLDAVNPAAAAVSADWRMIALVVILLRAGLEMSRQALAQVGLRAGLMAFIPCLFEVSAVTLAAPHLLGLTLLESAMLGSVLAAVSPAVVVPLMISFIEERKGEDKGAPTLILAGASCDDAVAIVLAGAFISMYAGSDVSIASELAGVPVSIVSGIAAGLGIGFFLCRFFEKFNPRATKRVLILLGLSIIILNLEKWIEEIFPFASLLAIMAAGFIILEKREHIAHELSSKLGKVWVFAQLLLFIFVGTEVNVPVALKTGLSGVAVIFIGLLGRSIAVQLCMIKSRFNARERLFITLAYLPKATVQAAIGAAPLAAMKAGGMNTAPGEIILAAAAMSIVITAPLGSIAISWGGRHLISQSPAQTQSPARDAAVESR